MEKQKQDAFPGSANVGVALFNKSFSLKSLCCKLKTKVGKRA
jgi:hypothetical protein